PDAGVRAPQRRADRTDDRLTSRPSARRAGGRARPPRPRAARRPPGELGGAGLADHGDADLTRVRQLVLDLLGDVAGDDLRLDVVDGVGLDHHPDLAAGLHREDLLDARVLLAGDLLQPLHALDVRLQRLPARPRAAAADGVGGLRDDRLDGPALGLRVVRLDGVHDVLVLAVPAGELRADQRVAALDLVGQRLADVVQQRAPLGDVHREPQLARHDPREVRGLDQVLQDVLPVGRAVPQLAEQRDQLRMHVGDADLHQRVLAGPHAQLLHVALAALVDLLDALRVDPPVEDELLQRQPPDLAPHGVEAAQQDRLRRVVDDQV